eukprot:365339-Chlamydomonas_euryale.AAC.6
MDMRLPVAPGAVMRSSRTHHVIPRKMFERLCDGRNRASGFRRGGGGRSPPSVNSLAPLRSPPTSQFSAQIERPRPCPPPFCMPSTCV